MDELKPGEAPEIPEIKTDPREDGEKRGAAAPWGAAGGAGTRTPIAQLAQRLGLGAQASGPLSFLSPVVGFLGGNLGMSLVTMLAVAGSVYGLYSLGMQAVHGPQVQKKQSIFASREDSARQSSAAQGEGGGSLGYLAGANRGALGEENQAQQPPASSEQAAEPQAPAAAATAADPGALEELVAKAAGSSAEGANLKSVLAGALGSKGLTFGAGANSGAAGGAGSMGAGLPQIPSMTGLPEGEEAGNAAALSQKGGRISASRARLSTGKGGVRGALGQLRVANYESRVGQKAAASESQSYHAEQAFGGASAAPGGSSSIGGSGVGGGASGGAGVGAGGGYEEGGPIGASGSPGQQAPPVEGVDVTPWGGMVMMAMSLLMMASLILTVMGYLNQFKYKTFVTVLVLKIQSILYKVALALSVAVIGIGVLLATMYGQTAQGTIFTVAGAAVATIAAIEMWTEISVPAWAMILAGIAGIGASIGALLAGGGAAGGLGQAGHPSSVSQRVQQMNQQLR